MHVLRFCIAVIIKYNLSLKACVVTRTVFSNPMNMKKACFIFMQKHPCCNVVESGMVE